ncbi:MAG: hypothetical protein HOP11_03100 [Saprospiraceae bacterium]|nr:hypothetical protein [Saprospiraceae bacterium]
MNWLNNLKKSTKKDWMDLVQKENANNYPNIIEHKIAPSINGLSFASHEDILEIPSNNLNRYISEPGKIGTSINLNNIDHSRTLLHTLLQNGVEHIIININTDVSTNDIQLLLEGVYTDMLLVEFRLSEELLKKTELLNIIKEKGCIASHVRYNDANISLPQGVNSILNFRVSEFLNHCQESINRIKSLANQTSGKVHIILQMGNHLLINVALYYALQLACKKYNYELNIEIQIDHSVSLPEMDPLIAASCVALAASICKPYSTNLFPTSNKINSAENQKSNHLQYLHMQHIINLESDIPKENPVAGSYYFENLCHKIYSILIQES